MGEWNFFNIRSKRGNLDPEELLSPIPPLTANRRSYLKTFWPQFNENSLEIAVASTKDFLPHSCNTVS